jgi:hypothetical protein
LARAWENASRKARRQSRPTGQAIEQVVVKNSQAGAVLQKDWNKIDQFLLACFDRNSYQSQRSGVAASRSTGIFGPETNYEG